MKKFLKAIGVLIGLAILAVVVTAALLPWMDRWGATDAEVAASFPADELVPSPAITYTRAVTVNASPEEIYPWCRWVLKAAYSYSWLETNILQCELINADHPKNGRD
jgi:hypothetical protein